MSPNNLLLLMILVCSNTDNFVDKKKIPEDMPLKIVVTYVDSEIETPIRIDDWVQLKVWPVKAGGSRGLYHGAIRDQQGRLGATLAQEMLLRSTP